MIKVRLQGTTRDLKRMRRLLQRNKDITVENVSELFTNKGTKKYLRQYMDIKFKYDEAKVK